MKILLIEDEPEMSSLAVSQLEKLGHEVLTAHTLRDAYAIYTVERDNLDMIIADHRMPDGPGVDFVLDLSYTEEKTKIAIVSGCLTGTEKRLLEGRNIPYFQKPILYSTVVAQFAKKAPSTSAPVDAPLVAPTPPPAKSVTPLISVKKGFTNILFSKFTLAKNLEESESPFRAIPPSSTPNSAGTPPAQPVASPLPASQTPSITPKPIQFAPPSTKPIPRLVLPKK
ncbi:MAG: response regulator [Verrucomicrobiota bacterium]|nr:response regulator [Verrucomicrobiota bacterium]